MDYIRRLLGSSADPSEQRRNVYHTAFLLQQRLPPELVLQILEYAGAWVKFSWQRDEELFVTEHQVSYDRVRLGSGPTGQGSRVYLSSGRVGSDGLAGPHPVRKIVFTITSKDQGWSDHLEDQGTYNNSWSWFEAVIPPTTSEANNWQPLRRKVTCNIHACPVWNTQTIEWSLESDDADEREFIRALRRGFWLDLECHARYPGWVNNVRSATIDIYECAIR